MKWVTPKVIAARWLAPALLALAVAGLSYSHWLVYGMGKTAQRVEMQSELDKAMQRQAELADELERAKAARAPKVREVIRFVERVADPTGCDVAPVPDSVLSAHGYRRD
jgi:Tfp pilus assembly protein PilO